MKVTIDSIEINENKLKAVVRLEDEVRNERHFDEVNVRRYVQEKVAAALAERVLLERGPEIMDAISNNQLINAVIMKVAGKLGGER